MASSPAVTSRGRGFRILPVGKPLAFQIATFKRALSRSLSPVDRAASFHPVSGSTNSA
jgi:hypothetical protein